MAVKHDVSSCVHIDDHITVDGVVNITHHQATQERFPDLACQVGGFVLTREGRLAYLRWAPPQGQVCCPPFPGPPGKGRYANTWDPATGTLGYVVPERTYPFLQRAIDEALGPTGGPINVLLLVGCNRYDVGTFRVQSYVAPRLYLAFRGTKSHENDRCGTPRSPTSDPSSLKPCPCPLHHQR